MADSVPSTWEEPRGPHLPDAVTGIPRPAWAFIVVAAVTLLLDVDDVLAIADTRSGPGPVISGVLRLAATLAFPLWGAAFFWRHPTGWRDARLVAIGTVLAAAYSLLEPVRQAIVIGAGFSDDIDRSAIISLVTGSISSAVGIARGGGCGDRPSTRSISTRR